MDKYMNTTTLSSIIKYLDITTLVSLIKTNSKINASIINSIEYYHTLEKLLAKPINEIIFL